MNRVLHFDRACHAMHSACVTPVQFKTACTNQQQVAYLAPMTDGTELQRLALQIERDLLARANFRTLLAFADVTVAGHRQELRTIKARIKRDSAKP